MKSIRMVFQKRLQSEVKGAILLSKELVNVIKNNIDLVELKELLKNMIAIKSHNQNPYYEERLSKFLYECLTVNGIEAKLSKVSEHRFNVNAVLKGENRGHSLILTGHLDTVGDYGVSGLFTPNEIGGRICGRGACDMKGSIASMIEAMFAIKRSRLILPYDLKLILVVDEEFKSIGTEYFIKSGERGDLAILGEPTNLDICPGNRGLEWLNIKVHGKETHGSTPEKGVNAVVMASRFIERVNKELIPKLSLREHQILGKAMMNIGAINGGFQSSSVPSECLIKIDRRWIFGESVEKVIGEYQQIIDELNREDPKFRATIERDETNMNEMEHGPCCMDIDNPLIKLASCCIKETLEKAPSIHAFTGWTDASLISNFAHIPTMILGPGDISLAHSERESIEVKELFNASVVYSLIALNFKP